MSPREPDERAYRRHVTSGRFQQGVDRGDWRIARDGWPSPVIAVAAVPRTGAPDEVALRFDLSGYPVTGPTAAPWDVERDDGLASDMWPTGGRVGTAFNPDWMPTPGRHAIYLPIDRLAIAGHDQWRQEDPAALWDPSRMDIVDYLKVIRELLHSSQYAGVRWPR